MWFKIQYFLLLYDIKGTVFLKHLNNYKVKIKYRTKKFSFVSIDMVNSFEGRLAFRISGGPRPLPFLKTPLSSCGLFST